jgi:hypothetical protein
MSRVQIVFVRRNMELLQVPRVHGTSTCREKLKWICSFDMIGLDLELR